MIVPVIGVIMTGNRHMILARKTKQRGQGYILDIPYLGPAESGYI